MTKLVIEIDCNNAAFDGADFGPELENILRNYAFRVAFESRGTFPTETVLRDHNGNRVGTATLKT